MSKLAKIFPHWVKSLQKEEFNPMTAYGSHPLHGRKFRSYDRAHAVLRDNGAQHMFRATGIKGIGARENSYLYKHPQYGTFLLHVNSELPGEPSEIEHRGNWDRATLSSLPGFKLSKEDFVYNNLPATRPGVGHKGIAPSNTPASHPLHGVRVATTEEGQNHLVNAGAFRTTWIGDVHGLGEPPRQGITGASTYVGERRYQHWSHPEFGSFEIKEPKRIGTTDYPGVIIHTGDNSKTWH